MNSTLNALEQTLILEYAVLPAGWVVARSVQQDPCREHYLAHGMDLAWCVPAAHRVRTVLS